MAQFRGGATKFISSPPKGGTFGGSPFFVLPSSVADQLIEQSHGDARVLESLLALNPGDLGDNPYRVDFPNPTGLRMASGNEGGASEKWVAGGYTKSKFMGRGVPETVIDPVPETGYRGRPVWGN